mmetsp:Transcript_8200/g.24440  ORF Transcript_8200/g.24440 Transcript_8200/m.24440 type:complete len:850 (-) Transcript_8200:2291-4840(-)
MKTIALVSGGKDSCYNMMLCQHYGHDIVALGNLLPVDVATDELDSWMFQTVGHQLVEAYAACTGLPLLRRCISGASRNTDMAYVQTAGDEVEDLAALLAFAQQRFPGLEGVASGAIASDYQRLRVESVCARLGLTSLAFLWRQPQAPLLRRMIDGGVEAILVKIAAIGLDPGKHLGRTLAQMEPLLHRLARQYGSNVCGEGGEYETLTLDCPLFARARIVLEAWQVFAHSPSAIAPVAVLHPTAFRLVPKANFDAAPAAEVITVPHDFVAPAALPLSSSIVEQPDKSKPPAHPQPTVSGPTSPTQTSPPPQQPFSYYEQAAGPHEESQPALQATSWPQRKVLSTLHSSPLVHELARCTSAETTAQALLLALTTLQSGLAARGLDWHDVVFVHLHLADLSHFAAANDVYGRVLPRVDPPARACLQLTLPPGHPVAVMLLLSPRQPLVAERHSLGSNQGPSQDGAAEDSWAAQHRQAPGDGEVQRVLRRVLHVQSISEWAPTCIGPYSQGAAVGGLVHLAGTIPLHPPTMDLVAGGAAEQLIRCMATCDAVATALGAHFRRGLLWGTVLLDASVGADEVPALEQLLLDHLRGQEAFDQDSSGSDDYEGGEEEHERWEGLHDSYLQAPQVQVGCPPPGAPSAVTPHLTWLRVPALPRGSLVEIVPVLATAPSGAPRQLDPSRLRLVHATVTSAAGAIDCDVLLTAHDNDSEAIGPVSRHEAPDAGSMGPRDDVAGRMQELDLRSAHAYLCSSKGSKDSTDKATLQRQLGDMFKCCGGTMGVSGSQWMGVSSIVVTHREGLGNLQWLAAAALAELTGSVQEVPVVVCMPVVQILMPSAELREVLLHVHVLAVC